MVDRDVHCLCEYDGEGALLSECDEHRTLRSRLDKALEFIRSEANSEEPGYTFARAVLEEISGKSPAPGESLPLDVPGSSGGDSPSAVERRDPSRLSQT
jgi:hypothetical protein